MKYIQSENAPAAVGPYSQAIEANGFIFCAGQIGMDPKTGNIADGIENQIRQIMINLAEVLKSAGSDLNQIVKTTIFIVDIGDFPKVNEIYGQYFTDHKPARSTVDVDNLPKGALVEIEAIAVVSA
jgi:2-iminobutanoate/2-iminopropanoate deaminase